MVNSIFKIDPKYTTQHNQMIYINIILATLVYIDYKLNFKALLKVTIEALVLCHKIDLTSDRIDKIKDCMMMCAGREI